MNFSSCARRSPSKYPRHMKSEGIEKGRANSNIDGLHFHISGYFPASPLRNIQSGKKEENVKRNGNELETFFIRKWEKVSKVIDQLLRLMNDRVFTIDRSTSNFGLTQRTIFNI